jgi:type I restriction enzyme, S subunit
LNPDVPMKDSGIEWIGEIPEHWDLTRLSELSSRAITYGIVKLGEEDEMGVKVLRCSDVKPGYIDDSHIRTVKKVLSDEYNRTILEGGEVIINVRGTLGGCAIVPYDYAGYNISREVAVVPVSTACNRYVMYCLLSASFSSYQDYSLRGVIYIGLNINLLSRYQMQQPPMNEQQDIADYLDIKCSKIDFVIGKKQTVIDKLTEYKKSLIY